MKKTKQPQDPLDMSDLTANYLKSLNKAVEKDQQEIAKKLERMKQPPKQSKLLKFFKWFKLKR